MGVLATLNPSLAEKQKIKSEIRGLDKREALVDERIQLASAGPQPDVEGTVANLELQDANKEKEDILRRRYELNPTKETYSAYTKQKSSASGVPIARLPADEDAQVEAMDRVAKQTQAKKTQIEKFRKHLAKLPTSLGGTVGDLDPSLQDKIAAQYTESERKALIDRMDRGTKNGK